MRPHHGSICVLVCAGIVASRASQCDEFSDLDECSASPEHETKAQAAHSFIQVRQQKAPNGPASLEWQRPEAATAHDVKAPKGPAAAPAHDVKAPKGPAAATAHDAKAPTGPAAATAHDIKAPTGPAAATAHDVKAPKGPASIEWQRPEAAAAHDVELGRETRSAAAHGTLADDVKLMLFSQFEFTIALVIVVLVAIVLAGRRLLNKDDEESQRQRKEMDLEREKDIEKNQALSILRAAGYDKQAKAAKVDDEATASACTRDGCKQESKKDGSNKAKTPDQAEERAKPPQTNQGPKKRSVEPEKRKDLARHPSSDPEKKCPQDADGTGSSELLETPCLFADSVLSDSEANSIEDDAVADEKEDRWLAAIAYLRNMEAAQAQMGEQEDAAEEAFKALPHSARCRPGKAGLD